MRLSREIASEPGASHLIERKGIIGKNLLLRGQPMSPETKKELEQHVQAISKILYAEADQSQLTSLSDIEMTIRRQVQENVSPYIGSFLSKMPLTPPQDTHER